MRSLRRGPGMTDAGAPDWDVLVCRGCCCGSARKHRRTDHEGQLDDLRTASAAGGGSRVLVADCLDRCDDSNVVLLRPSRTAKRAGPSAAAGPAPASRPAVTLRPVRSSSC